MVNTIASSVKMDCLLKILCKMEDLLRIILYYKFIKIYFGPQMVVVLAAGRTSLMS